MAAELTRDKRRKQKSRNQHTIRKLSKREYSLEARTDHIPDMHNYSVEPIHALFLLRPHFSTLPALALFLPFLLLYGFAGTCLFLPLSLRFKCSL